jgi:hypothetical protein
MNDASYTIRNLRQDRILRDHARPAVRSALSRSYKQAAARHLPQEMARRETKAAVPGNRQ